MKLTRMQIIKLMKLKRIFAFQKSQLLDLFISSTAFGTSSVSKKNCYSAKFSTVSFHTLKKSNNYRNQLSSKYSKSSNYHQITTCTKGLMKKWCSKSTFKEKINFNLSNKNLFNHRALSYQTSSIKWLQHKNKSSRILNVKWLTIWTLMRSMIRLRRKPSE